jgi:hypothetical protein
VYGDDPEQLAAGLSHIGRAGWIVRPGLDSVCRRRLAVLWIAQLVQQFVDRRGVGAVGKSDLHAPPSIRRV